MSPKSPSLPPFQPVGHIITSTIHQPETEAAVDACIRTTAERIAAERGIPVQGGALPEIDDVPPPHQPQP